MSKDKIKIIGIDARFYGPIGKGLGRYTQEIVDNTISIISKKEDIRFVIFLSPDNFESFIIDRINVKKVLVKARWYTLMEQIEFPFLIQQERISLMHFPHFNVPLFSLSPFVVTIHDLILTKFPTHRASTLHPFIYWLKDLAYRLIIYSAVKKSKNIITVSNFTKNDIIQKFKVDPEKVIVTYEGVADLAKGSSPVNANEILGLYNISKQYLLYVGNAYPHKNLNGLILIFSKLRIKHPNLQLVLVGKEDYFYNRVKEFAYSHNLWQKENHNSSIIFPGYVPDVHLEVLFKKASIYIFPSLYEGFGLPPLEAMAHGCPVISSNKASMPEILGSAAEYFDPNNEREALDVIEEVLGNNDKRQKMIEKGYEHVKKYSWQECGKKTSEIYLNVINGLK